MDRAFSMVIAIVGCIVLGLIAFAPTIQAWFLRSKKNREWWNNDDDLGGLA